MHFWFCNWKDLQILGTPCRSEIEVSKLVSLCLAPNYRGGGSTDLLQSPQIHSLINQLGKRRDGIVTAICICFAFAHPAHWCPLSLQHSAPRWFVWVVVLPNALEIRINMQSSALLQPFSLPRSKWYIFLGKKTKASINRHVITASMPERITQTKHQSHK